MVEADYPRDPLGSPMWQAHAAALFGKDAVRFDPRVVLSMPALAENQHCFPVMLDARGLGPVSRMVILADLNPIPLAVDYRPVGAAPFIAARIKLDQRTPVRGAVQQGDGTWLVGGGWIDAAGGGCSAPPVSRVRGDWAQHLGEMRGRAWHGPEGTRLRVLIRHPMDTGFVAGIATYNIETLRMTSGDRVLGEMEMWASVSEDPAFTLMPHAAPGEVLTIAARDSNGRDYTGNLTVEIAP
jgi:sulfur-oxidizing protein SoxY